MGFQRKKVFVLEFADGEFAGLEARMRPVSVGEMLEITELADSKDPGRLRVMYSRFAASLLSWNVEDEHGAPVPATEEGVFSQDDGLVSALIGAWQNAMAGKVDGPKESPSTVGLPPLVASLPMEPSLPARVS